MDKFSSFVFGRRSCAWVVVLALCLGLGAAHAQIISTPNSLYRIAGGTQGANDGTGTDAQFSALLEAAVRNIDGNLYVPDLFNHTVRRITPAGVVTTFAGTAGTCGAVDATGTAAQFCRPAGITADGSGNLFVTDLDNQKIRRITLAGDVTTIAGAGAPCGAADGTGTAARFCNPFDITLDDAGNLYVTDLDNETMRRITPTGEVTTIAGAVGVCGEVDGTGTAAQFCAPHGIAAVDGDLYVADEVGHVIRKITPAGEVTTFAGTAGTCGAADGIGTAAQFCFPVGMAADSGGNLYVADAGNFSIRRITPAGVVSTVAGTTGNVALGAYPTALPGTLSGQPLGVAVIGANQLAITTNSSEVLGVNLAPASVPMTTFSPSLVATLSPAPNRFVFTSSLTLGTNGAPFNPASDSVLLQFGPVSLTIPANSFQPASGGYAFQGVLGGMTVMANVQPQGGGRYQVIINATGASLSGLANPVKMSLTLGSNVGTKTITASISPKSK
jgi:sugar lactone lactonase YvrE